MTLAVILLVVGLALIVAEVCFPSFGALGIAAAICIGVACVSAFAAGATAGWIFLAATALGVPGALWLGFRILPHSPVGKFLVNKGSSFDKPAAVDPLNETLAGKAGVAESMLRPGGTARIGERRVDVVTRGEFLEAGTPLVVVEIEGNRVVVARQGA
ncbi:MAG: hypothetical protein RIR65_2202 [Planctomycetota bacterium]